MEKAILKNVLSNLQSGNKLVVNFISEKSDLNGEYVVLGTKKGRGKGGSMLAELKREDETNLVLATKDSDDVVNLIFDGNMFGYESEDDIPPDYEKNAGMAVTLKNDFKHFEKVSADYPKQLTLQSSTVEELNGSHMIVGYKQLRGRQGQVVLTTSTGLEIWSYRHSGVIDSYDF